MTTDTPTCAAAGSGMNALPATAIRAAAQSMRFIKYPSEVFVLTKYLLARSAVDKKFFCLQILMFINTGRTMRGI
jgi:hypothetical protein